MKEFLTPFSLRTVLLLFLVLGGILGLKAQPVPNDPCTATAFDANGGGSLVPCGSAANTNNNLDIGSSSTTTFNLMNIAGDCPAPTLGQKVYWMYFDIQQNAGTFEFQIVGNGSNAGNLYYQLWYSDNQSCNTSSLNFLTCGEDFSAWLLTPSPTFPQQTYTRYYIAVYAQTGVGSGTFLLKFRRACGEACEDVTTNIIVNAGPDKCVAEGKTVQLNGSATGGTSPYTYFWIPSDGIQNPTSSTPLVSPTTTTTYTLYVSGSGNIEANACPGEDDVTVRVVKVNCPASNGGTFNCITDLPSPTDLPAGTVIENADCGTVSVTSTDVLGGGNGCSTAQTVTRTYTIRHDLGTPTNTADDLVKECTVVYSILDNVEPTITHCPSNLSLICGDSNNSSLIAAWLTSFSATDNCSNITYYNDYNPTDFTGCGVGSTKTVTFKASDGCGNISSCTATITVGDDTNPTIDCSAINDLEVQCGADNTTAITTWLNSVTATDACGTATVTNNYNANAFSDLCGNTGVQTVTFTATDACGNTITCTKTITIKDTVKPIITCPATDLVLECGADNTTAIATWLNSVTATDACGTVIVTNNYATTLFPSACGTGTKTVTFTATDACGNTATCTKNVTIKDTTKPILSQMPANINLGCSGIVPTVPAITATDNCSTNVVVTFTEISSYNCATSTKTITRTWKAIDCSANMTIHIQTISITCPLVVDVKKYCATVYGGATTATLTASGGGAPYTWSGVGIIGSNTGASISVSVPAGSTYTYTVKDVYNCTKVVTVSSCYAPCLGFRTQTQGGWGSTPSGNNPGTYLANNFATCFPNGITVGCSTTGRTLKLTSAQAVDAFLPSSGVPTALTQNWTNPGSLLNNTLAGQVVALTISVTLDQCIASYSSSSSSLACLVITSGPLVGKTVQEALTIGNQILGGCYTGTLTASQINAILTSINESYVNGISTGSYLTCNPDASCTTGKTDVAEIGVLMPAFEVQVYPNPTEGSIVIQYVLPEAATISAIIRSIDGKEVARILDQQEQSEGNYTLTFDGDHLPNGMYLYEISTNANRVVGKILKQ